MDCRKIDLYIKGNFDSMENVTVSAYCNFTIDHAYPTETGIDHLDIKTFGSVQVLTDRKAITTLYGTTLTVRSGAQLFSNDLDLSYTNITIEPYGKLYVDEGVPEREQSTGIGVGHSGNGCSGGGHGGNGGQGQGQSLSGGSHGSFLAPDTFGKNGGHQTFPHQGGRGGGRLNLKVSHTLTMDGEVTARGGIWRSVRAGGGSGGTIMIQTYTIDGSGVIDASGGDGYGGVYASHGGGGGGGRIALYYKYNYYVGVFRNAGGRGGNSAEAGSAGTCYLHLIPESTVNGEAPPGFVHNRTLYLDNLGQTRRLPLENLTDTYANYSLGSGLAWLFPASYPDFVPNPGSHFNSSVDIVLDYLQIYRGAHLALLNANASREHINMTVGSFAGDRSGHLRIGYNQALYIGTGELPMDVSLYHGSEATLQGELRVAGVRIMVEGMLKNVENLTVVDGGELHIGAMMDKKYNRIDEIQFIAFNIRNRGSLYMNNGAAQHVLNGQTLQVYPGGLLSAKKLLVLVKQVTVDVLGEMQADNTGYCSSEGLGGGYTVDGRYGSGGSHGGEGGFENETLNSPLTYGSFITPDRLGSGGGNGFGANGGCGGGALTLILINGTLKVDGRLSANGQDGGTNAGGGSGGSIYIVCKEFDGTGTVEVKGGSGRNGGGGGRLAVEYAVKNFIGSLESQGGVGSGGENGAAGTVLTKDHETLGTKTLVIYNRKGSGKRKTKITIPETKTVDFDMDVVDLGNYAEVGLLATDNNGNPSNGSRALKLTQVQGDHTATIHVEQGMKLNIDFNSTAVLSFSVVLYEEATVNLPHDTYLKDSSVTLYGGVLEGLHTLNISMNGAFTMYPPAKLNNSNSDNSSSLYLNSISILDGGVFHYKGMPENRDELHIILDGGLVIRGGGELHANKLYIKAVNITVDAEGLISASGRGWTPNVGSGSGIASSQGSSGGSHGGLGGQGPGMSHAGLAYGKLHTPTDYGSGGGASSIVENSGLGGGIIYMETKEMFEVDGIITADGGTGIAAGMGGGAGGSILLKAGTFLGTGTISASGGAGACVPHCAKCDTERHCLACVNGYTWYSYNCVTSYSDAKIVGGGGGGGRVAVYASTSYNFRGEYQTYGGKSDYEQGGSGTVYTRVPNGSGDFMSSVTIDNRGDTPLNQYISDRQQDSMRTYIVTYSGDTIEDMTFDHVNILGSGHLSFRNVSETKVPITIQNLHGDKTGMLHTSVDQNIVIENGDVPFPVSFRVYDRSNITLPAEVRLIDLAYKTVYMDGMIDGVKKLYIGQGVNFLIGEKGYYKGYNLLNFGLDSLEIYADGVMSSTFEDEHILSLNLLIDNEFRLYAGSKIEAPSVKITANNIQIDAAGKIDNSGKAKKNIYQSGVTVNRGGGSGGGNGAAGGQGSEQSIVGAPPYYGSMYTPQEYGGNGGSGGVNGTDIKCGSSATHIGGRGGGVIYLEARTSLTLDGELRSDGESASGPMGGGGAGGSIYLITKDFHGDGTISVVGGSVPQGGSCRGGGGGGGRVAIHYQNSTFEGTTKAYGGAGYECGGAGTVLWRQTTSNGYKDKLFVDNANICDPIKSRIDWSILSDAQRGEHSFYTWFFDPRDINTILAAGKTFTHEFEEIHLSGKAQLALHRKNTDTYNQFIVIHKTVGDKNGMFHIGPHQEILAELPTDSPEIQFGLLVYSGGLMRAEKTLLIYSITLDMEGILSGVEKLVIGPKGKVVLRPYGNTTSAVTREITFSEVTVQGGGQLVIDSNSNGVILRGDILTVETGGILEADKLDLIVKDLEVEDSGLISADAKSRVAGGGIGVGKNGAGAGHGGQGGRGSSTTAGGMYYGNTIYPMDFGSNSMKDVLFGQANIVIYGGGVLNIRVNNTARIDGTIRSNGADGNSEIGGASGGSIYIQTNWLYGKGLIQLNGGNGFNGTGGGSGGRLAVIYQNSEFTGSYTAYGGDSTTAVGGAGTVYVQAGAEKMMILDNNRVHIVQREISSYSNVSKNDSSRTWLTFPSGNSLSIDKLYLLNGAHLALESSSSLANQRTLTITTMYGDNFVNHPELIGTLHVGPYQQVTVMSLDLYMPAHVLVYENGILRLPSNVKWYNAVISLRGTLSGVQYLTLIHSSLKLYNTSRTLGSDMPAKFQFSAVNVLAKANITMTSDKPDFPFQLLSQNISIGGSGSIIATNLKIVTDKFETEQGGVVNLDGQGYIKAGAGFAPNQAGACHGGQGGPSTVSSQMCSCYDDFRSPSLPGSGGEDSNGGGVLKIQARSIVHDGLISANGQSGSGGGSGGSIILEATTMQITGLIQANGGSGLTATKNDTTVKSGGGGGGLIALIYQTGYVTGNITTDGGKGSTNAQTGASGILYVKSSTYSKAEVTTNEATTALTLLPVPETEIAPVKLDTLIIHGVGIVGFAPRNGSAMKVELSMVTGSPAAVMQVSNGVEVYFATRSGLAVDKLILQTSILVEKSAQLDLPAFVTIEKNVSLDLCGSLTTTTRDILVQNYGTLALAYPASLQLNSLAIDYLGKFSKSSKCATTSNKANLQLVYFNSTSGLPASSLTTYFSLSAGYGTGTLTAVGPALNRTCDPGSNLILLRNQSCFLEPRVHVYNSIIINPGAELRLDGDSSGTNKTKIIANKINIMFSGKITGAGTGYQSGGPGAGTGSNIGATYGGTGEGSSSNPYGSITDPLNYGSNGFGAIISQGRGGGQIELQSSTVIVDGIIDMDAGPSSSSGGSGGSILINCLTLSGSGVIQARGGVGGGGGGRIAINATNSNAFTGQYLVDGGTSSSGQGSSGTVFLERNSSDLILKISGKGSKSSTLRGGLNMPSVLSELHIDHGTTVQLDVDVIINKLKASGNGEIIIVGSGITLGINSFADSQAGSLCNFIVENGGKLNVNTVLFVSNSVPKLEVNDGGLVVANQLIIGNGGILNISATGKVQVSSAYLNEGSLAQLNSGAQLGVTQSKVSLSSFRLGYNASISFGNDNVTIESTSFKMDPFSQIKLEGFVKEIHISGNDIIIQDGAIISASRGGSTAGSGAGAGGKGASYGGEGGNNSGTTYGSTSNPIDFGSGTSYASGGGIITLNGQNKVEFDGTVSVDGEDGNSANGGASGGTILIRAGSFIGHGHISSKGGQGMTSTSGGGGGRVAVYASSISDFHGDISTTGGKGSASGAAGTTYLSYILSGASKTEVIVDNLGEDSISKTVVTSVSRVSKLDIRGNAQLLFNSSGVSQFSIESIDGDYTGKLFVQGGQEASIATAYGTQHAYGLKCKLDILFGGIATMPAKLLLKDDERNDFDNVNLNVDGTILGLRDLIIASGGIASFGYKSNSGLDKTKLEPQGTLVLNNLDVATSGTLLLGMDTASLYTLTLREELNVKYGGTLRGKNLAITSPMLQVAYNGLLHVNEGGNPSETGKGAGFQGIGGSFGGTGGSPISVSSPSVKYYGSFNMATEAGSGGGNSSGGIGGNGGGILGISVTDHLILNGIISANGGPGLNGGGGGSGGSVAVVTLDMSGAGSIFVRGGSSNSTGGGGGGGRVVLDVTGVYNYSGLHSLSGGSSVSGGAGGSGTAFIKTLIRNLPSFELQVSNEGASGTEQGHTYIDYSSSTRMSVDHLKVGADTVLDFMTSGLHYEVEVLTCDLGSTIIVHDSVIFSADINEDYSKSRCSFVVQQGAELRLPNKVELLGASNSFEGTLTNIRDMVISSNQKATFSSKTRTAGYTNGQYTYKTEPGAYKFSTFTIKDYAQVTFEATGKIQQLGTLELHYGAVLFGDMLMLWSNDIIMHPGSTINLTGRGYPAGTGPGYGEQVSGIGTGAGHGASRWIIQQQHCWWFLLQS